MISAHLLLFIHILSAVVWVGGMITVRFVVHPLTISYEDMQQRIERSLKVSQRLLMVAALFVVASFVSGLMLSLGLKSKPIELYIKEAIWLAMFVNFMLIFFIRDRAQKVYNNFDISGAKSLLSPVANILLPLNITLGLIAIYLGTGLRGF